MAKKVTITLDDEILTFVDRQAAALDDKANRSAYINAVLAAHRRSVLEAEIIAALKEDAEDPEYQAEVAAWDCVARDGIDATG
ncbi:MAG TPA: CopG family transcriptional regulator [Cyanobacteria bacterium UBA11049]|nr:CopG family transcriptional regulator [Cyanobacteria bacterium UBA11049]